MKVVHGSLKGLVEEVKEEKVDTVRVVNVAGKSQRFGRSVGCRSDWKKAYVRLAEGQAIEMAGAERA